MSATLCDDIAAIIREVDGDNTMSAADLGLLIGCRLAAVNRALYADEIMRFVRATNPDKRMGAGRLAELLVAEFDLDTEQ